MFGFIQKRGGRRVTCSSAPLCSQALPSGPPGEFFRLEFSEIYGCSREP